MSRSQAPCDEIFFFHVYYFRNHSFTKKHHTDLHKQFINLLSVSCKNMQIAGIPIADKILLNVSVMVNKCLNGRAPDYLSQKFTCRQAHHNRNT